MHYIPHVTLAFDSVEHIMRDVSYGHLIRYTHANGASFYFVCLYCHVFRSLYYKTFIKNGVTWQVGVVILLLSMATAFLGYVLPWGQMSFWGATVITNLFSVIPFLGTDIVHTLWGGYSVGAPTLTRFYSLHFLLPLIVLWLVIIHILLLHEKGSSTPNKIFFGSERVSFLGFFGIKDIYLVTYSLSIFSLFLIFGPNVLNHPDNYNLADPMQTPPHIVPEWYFLPFYAILRAIPNKTLGVVAFAGSILILIFLPIKRKISKPKTSNNLQFAEKVVFWLFIIDVFFLGYLGGMPIE
jgi:quinol-cytochrome oxidoreductase complex cytochrome b subunit